LQDIHFAYCFHVHLYVLADFPIYEEPASGHPLELQYDLSTGEAITKVERKPFSVQIISTGFKLLGETLFPPDRYYQTNFFIAPEGLYLSNNNDWNPEAREDRLSFTLL